MHNNSNLYHSLKQRELKAWEIDYVIIQLQHKIDLNVGKRSKSSNTMVKWQIIWEKWGITNITK